VMTLLATALTKIGFLDKLHICPPFSRLTMRHNSY
jgi:hypothetical protein